MNGGTTVVLVSHSESDIRRICQKAVWIEQGDLRSVGDIDMILKMYKI